jgi:hypothetical protein
MKIRQLTSRPGGMIAAAIQMDNGEEVEVVFTTERRDDITVANPDQAIFDREALDAASIRAIIAAVIAFGRVAEYSAEPAG